MLALHFTVMLLIISVCSINATNSSLLERYEDFSNNPFNGTVLERYVNFRFRLTGNFKTFKNFTEEEHAMIRHEPMIYERFDWIFARGALDGMLKNTTTDPRSVLYNHMGNRVDKIVADLRRVPLLQPNQQRVLVIAGEDTNLSVLAGAKVSKNNSPAAFKNFYSSRFSSIYYEATNVRFLNFKTVPMGFTHFYVLQPTPGLINRQIEAAKRKQPQEKQLAFAAWGRVWSFLDRSIHDRIYLARFLKNSTLSSSMSRLSLSFDEYWSQLGNYKYALCPRGSGIQAPKIFESLVLRVVPVVTRIAAFEDLVQLGFPILIIEKWEQLSVEFLQQMYVEKFLHVDWARVDRMITVDGVWSMLMNEGTYPF